MAPYRSEGQRVKVFHFVLCCPVALVLVWLYFQWPKYRCSLVFGANMLVKVLSYHQLMRQHLSRHLFLSADLNPLTL